jgi:NAD(P)-dependent dehydrogenase (short-subunit alcohol dehydrogenase family)
MIVLVTGATPGGIGSALSLAFAQNGCKVYASSRKAPGLLHPNIENIILDVNDDDNVKKVVNGIVNKEGALDILVNNAGVLGIGVWILSILHLPPKCLTQHPNLGPLVDIEISRVKKIFDTNTFAAIRLTQAVAPHMQHRRRGLIINMGSITGNMQAFSWLFDLQTTW